MKGHKLHELTAERLAELVKLQLPKSPPPDIKVSAPDPHNPTRDQALLALRSVYRQLLSGKPILNPKGVANRMVAPAILYLESLTPGKVTEVEPITFEEE
jgi:hypothetical protein